MNPLLIAGSTIVNLALLAYTLFFYSIIKFKILKKSTLVFLILGVSLDILATSFMITGSSKGPFTLHGIVGYSSLTAMLCELYFLVQFVRKFKLNSNVTLRIRNYTIFAYTWWISAYITGILLVVFR